MTEIAYPSSPFSLASAAANTAQKVWNVLQGQPAVEVAGTFAPSIEPDLAEIIERCGTLPAQTAILGVCADGMPVLFDLVDPRPGSLLVVGDDFSGRLEVLQNLVQSSVVLNSPRQVQYLVLSANPERQLAWAEWSQGVRHHLTCQSVYNRNGEEWILRLAEWARQRQLGHRRGPAVIFVLEDLAPVIEMDYDIRLNFEWLLREGPKVQIWPVVAADSQAAPVLGRWVNRFSTLILGHATDQACYQELAGLSREEAENEIGQGEFIVHLASDWLRFGLASTYRYFAETPLE